MFKKGILILLTLVLLISAVSCNKPADADTSKPASTAEYSSSGGDSPSESTKADDFAKLDKHEAAVEPEKADGNGFIFPVEGLRPYAVMIDNEGTKSLPQGGMDKAQIIYEVIVEGGETRLMPVFWGTDPQLIGPVRSSRHYFLDYAMEHDAIYVHFGWSPMAKQDISKFKINNINGVANGGEIFWDLTKDRGNWQDSYTSMEKIKVYVKKVNYRTSTDRKLIFAYSKEDGEPADGKKAEKISIRYSHSYTCSYTYDSPARVYKRFRKGQPQMERGTGKQLEAKNIIIQYVKNSSITGDSAGRQDVQTAGSGSGWFISCGKAIKINWYKDSRTSSTKYTDESGKAIVLNPGQTWVQIVPLFGNVEIE